MGFTGYAPAKEAEMLAALQQHANEKANEAAQHAPATELQGEVAQAQQIEEETANGTEQ